jgi:hypothetical protein
MEVEIIPYTAEYIEDVRQFNQRMARGGEGEFQLPCDLRQFEESQRTPIPWAGWLAVEEGIVRGGYLLGRQDFSFGGDIRNVGFYKLSVSEGAIDPAYAKVGIRMVTNATSLAPLAFALGMGGVDKRLPRFLKAFGWKLHEIPFLFRVVHPGNFVRNMAAIRRTRLRQVGLDLMAFSGAARVGIGVVQAFRRKTSYRRNHVTYEETPDFGHWSDSIWSSCGDSFSMIAVRDSRALNTMYPGTMPRISRLKVYSSGKIIGWAVVLNTQMKGHKQFGNLQVGTLVDCLARHEDAPVVAEAAERFLESKGVDIIVSNQSHKSWRSALLDRGYFEGPTNFALAISRGITRLLDPLHRNLTRIHMTRGDGDGPIHL